MGRGDRSGVESLTRTLIKTHPEWVCALWDVIAITAKVKDSVLVADRVLAQLVKCVEACV